MSARVIARDQSLTPGRYCCAEAEISGQPPESSGWSMPSQPRCVAPLAPAWPSCMPMCASLCVCTQSTMRAHASPCASVYRPGQPLVMRASALTQVISAITSAAPPIARAPRCTRW